MDELKKLGCRYPAIQRFLRLCSLEGDDREEIHEIGIRGMVERQNTAPDGQVLPEWMTWVAVSRRISVFFHTELEHSYSS